MVYVNASHDESQDLPMREANACGVPAVVFDCRGQYSDHCEFINYGIVVNDVNDIDSFRRAMILIGHYHLCTRFLKINCFAPLDHRWKFFDFPICYVDFMEFCEEKKKKIYLTVKQFHIEGLKYILSKH